MTGVVMRLVSPFLFALLCLILLQWGTPPRLTAADLPALPAGASLAPLAAPAHMRTDYHAEMIAVDWTHPLLRVRVENGLPAGRDLPLSWGRAERQDPKALRIQLVEPEPEGDRWSLALPVDGSSGNGEARAQPHFAIGGLCPWLPGGPPLGAEPELVSPLTQNATRMAARWLSRVKNLDAMTSLTFQGRCLVSWTSLRDGTSRFAVVVHEGRGEGKLDDLRPWLKAESRPGEWMAVHSFGENALAGLGDWRLGGPRDPRRPERIGGVLCLSNIMAGDPVDWARLPGCTVLASSFEPGYSPAGPISGLLWPNPLAPVAWISRLGAHAGEVPWVEIDLARSRPIDRIVLVWPIAQGWSEQFTPRRVRLLAGKDSRSEMQLLQEFTEPSGAFSIWQSPTAVSARHLRVEFPEPAAPGFEERGRLCAIQVWGPWDGVALRP